MRYEFSAGGVVYKNDKRQTMVLVCQNSQHHGWVFPKGLIGDHIESESKEETAIREVEEETGILAKIIKPLSPVAYWYVWPSEAGSRSTGEKEKIKKTVYYYIMEHISGDTTKHDTEMENVEWLPMDDIEKRLTYKADKKIWEEAKKFIKN